MVRHLPPWFAATNTSPATPGCPSSNKLFFSAPPTTTTKFGNSNVGFSWRASQYSEFCL
ncbi:hypothetical protein B0T12DRAFT_409153 [Alternaria alternata]|nr:hypothetical protein B0T12DRAFT_409153 [Alternaria alternata]